MLGLVKVKDDQGRDASHRMIWAAMPVKNEAALMIKPAIQGENAAVKIKAMTRVNVSMPRRGTAMRLAINVTAEIRLK